jgi:hypothetical protein
MPTALLAAAELKVEHKARETLVGVHNAKAETST